MKTIKVKLGEIFEVELENCPYEGFKKKKIMIDIKEISIHKSINNPTVPIFKIEEL